MVDGPTLREAREKLRLGVREFSRLVRLSHGHISKMERGEAGRPATPYVIAKYEQVLGMPVHAFVGHAKAADVDGSHLTSRSRTQYLQDLEVILEGERSDQNLEHRLDRYGVWPPPLKSGAHDLRDMLTIAEMLSGMDSTAAGWVARLLVRWLVRDTAGDPVDPHLHLILGELALTAAGAATREQEHAHARTLHLAALHAAVAAGDTDLRARALIEVARHLWRAGWRVDCTEVLDRIGDAEHLSEQVRTGIKELRAEDDALERER